jgi:KaiC/GvpD/RAD55 family RecA-like ATPase
MAEQIDYSIELQRLYLQMFLHDAETFVRVQNIFDPELFDRNLRTAAAFIKEHVDKYRTLPSLGQVSATTGQQFDEIEGLDEGHINWLLDEFEQFTRHKALERAIIQSADLLEKGQYADVETKIKAAVQIGLTKDMGTDYFDDPKERLMRIKNNNGQTSTGWPALDRKLYGGFNKGELNIFCGGSGSGKSLFMQNLSLNWALAGLSGIYFTLELSEELTSMRLDSMLTDVPSKEIFKRIDDVELKVRMMAKKSGNLQVKYMSAGSTTNDFRAYIKEYTTRTKIKPEFICVDYLDLCFPNNKRVDPSNLFVKDKFVSEELRNLAKEQNCLFVTASQLNRASVEEVEFDHSHIAGGISKINTADNVIGIFTSRAMRERGRYQIQFMKTRSSSAVGQKVDLEFDTETLRIRDLGEEESASSYRGNAILDSLKTRSTVNVDNTGVVTNSDPQPAPKNAQVLSSKLSSMLKSLNDN